MCLNLKRVLLLWCIGIVNGELKLVNYDLLLEVESHDSVILVKNEEYSTRLNVSYDRVFPNIEENSIFYTLNNTIYKLNLTSNTHDTVTAGTSVSELNSASKRVYWVEGSRLIKSYDIDLNTTTDLVQEPPNCVIHSIAIHDRTVYYTKTCNNTRTNSSIMSYNGTLTTLATYTQLPRSLVYSNASVYWINNPPGIYFTITRVSTLTKQTTRVVRLSQQHATSLAVCSGIIFWTDVKNNLYTFSRNHTIKITTHPTTFVHSLSTASKFTPLASQSSTTPDAPSTPESGTTPQAPTPIKSPKTTPQAPSTPESGTTPPKTPSTPESGTTPPKTPSTPESSTTRPKTPPNTTPHPLESPNRPKESHEGSERLRTCTLEESSSCNHVCIVLNTKITCLQEDSPSDWSPTLIAVISVLSTLLTLTTLSTVYMTLRVRNLNKKPIIRRRVVVNRRASESSSSPTSVCEMIDIENCCNMNVCETPCYERGLLQPPPTTTSVISVNTTNGGWKSGPKDDKKCLLSI